MPGFNFFALLPVQDNSKQAQELIGILTEAKQHVNPKLLELREQWRRFGKGGKGIDVGIAAPGAFEVLIAAIVFIGFSRYGGGGGGRCVLRY